MHVSYTRVFSVCCGFVVAD